MGVKPHTMGGLSTLRTVALAHIGAVLSGGVAGLACGKSTEVLGMLHALWQTMQLLQWLVLSAACAQCTAAKVAQWISPSPCALTLAVEWSVCGCAEFWIGVCAPLVVASVAIGAGKASMAMASPSRPRTASKQIMSMEK